MAERDYSDSESQIIIQASMDGFWKVAQDGRIIDCNEAACAMLGYRREEMLTLSLHDVDLIEDEARAAEHVGRVIAQGHDRFETRHRHKDGSGIDVEVSAYCVPGNDALLLFAFSRDISARKAADRALREMQFFKQTILDAVSAQVAVIDGNGIILEVNQSWCRFAKENAPLPDRVSRTTGIGASYLEVCRAAAGYSAEGAEDAARGIQAVLEGRLPQYEQEYPCHAPHQRRWFLMTVTPLGQAQGGAVISHHDISAPRLLAEELSRSEARTRSILRTAPVGIGVLVERVFLEVNESFCSMTGYAAEELVGHSARMLYPSEEDFQYVGAEKYRQIREQGIGRVETRFRTKDDRMLDVALSSAPVVVDDLSRGVIFTAQDITAIKQAEQERLVRETTQRDALVREVHHRIKNHLQGVLGLMRNAMADHPELAGVMKSIVTRVNAITQVYGLQGNQPGMQVRICELMQTAVHAAVSAVPIRLEFLVDDREAILSPDEAVPMALVINELITNAVKHSGVPAGHRPIQASLDITHGKASIVVKNAPARLPPGFDWASNHGLGNGLQLLKALLPRKSATLEYRQEEDTVVAELILEAPIMICRPVRGSD